MFKRPTYKIEYKKKKFEIQGFNVIESLNCRSRFRQAQAKKDEEALTKLAIEMLLIAIVKPTVKKKDIETMPENDLLDLLELVTTTNGFAPGKKTGKSKKS